MRKLLCLELNELNFEFVEHYARIGALPAIARRLKAHGYARTRSEPVYEHIEPWIQWFTVHTGKAFGEHKVFRLGDGPQAGERRIWEEQARRGLREGAVSPINAGNALADAAVSDREPASSPRVTAPRSCTCRRGWIRCSRFTGSMTGWWPSASRSSRACA